MFNESRQVAIKRWVADRLAASIGRLTDSPGGLKIFTFHDISDNAGDVYGVTEKQFGDFLAILSDEGYSTIRAGDLAATWPMILDRERVALLTFDDGYVSQRDIAAETLSRRGMTATFFAVSSFVDRKRSRRESSGNAREYLSVADLRQLANGEFEVGSHSHTHALLGTLSREQMDAEIRSSKRILEDSLGREIVSFAYPYGRRGAFSSATRAALEACGYAAAFTQGGTRIGPTNDVLELSRTSVDRLDTPATFRRKLRGQYDFLRELTQGRSRM